MKSLSVFLCVFLFFGYENLTAQIWSKTYNTLLPGIKITLYDNQLFNAEISGFSKILDHGSWNIKNDTFFLKFSGDSLAKGIFVVIDSLTIKSVGQIRNGLVLYKQGMETYNNEVIKYYYDENKLKKIVIYKRKHKLKKIKTIRVL